MHLEVRSSDFSVTPGLQFRVERRLEFALGRFGDSIRRVLVRLQDLNGPHGGVDKQCSIEVSFRRGGKCLLEDVDQDMYAAIDRGADRAGRLVRRLQHRGHNAQRDRRLDGNWWALGQAAQAKDKDTNV